MKFGVRVVALLAQVAALVLLAGCAPRTGTIFGRIEKNGTAVSFQEVSAVRVLEGGEEKSIVLSADNAGTFVFENLEPGTYYVMTTFSIITPESTGGASGGLLPWQQPQTFPQPFAQPFADPLGRVQAPGSCHTTDGSMSVLSVVGSNDSGDAVTISVISNSEDPFEIKAGDRVETNISVFCR